MGDDALRIAEIVGDVDQAERIEEAEAALLVAGDVEADEAAALLICRRASSYCGWLGSPG